MGSKPNIMDFEKEFAIAEIVRLTRLSAGASCGERTIAELVRMLRRSSGALCDEVLEQFRCCKQFAGRPAAEIYGLCGTGRGRRFLLRGGRQ